MNNNLEVFNFNGVNVIDSREVAEMTGKQHAHLMRDIKGYIEDISQNPNLDSDVFFIESSYQSGTGKRYKCYLLTKQGCEFVANKMTGKKGNQFTAAYVTMFNKMEQQVKLPQTPEEQLMLTMKVATRTVERVDNLEKDVEYLKQTSEITESMKSKLEIQRNRRVVKLCGGVESNFYKEGKAQKLYRQLFQHFKRYFGVTKYATLEKKDFEEAVKFIDNWSPDFELRQEIKQVNAQLNLIDGGLEDEKEDK